MAKVIMIQGTMSNAGKSLLVAGLCRVFSQDGYRVAPFKSQNMALNSYITNEGLEMGRAQVMQAEAAGIEPSVLMNPILLKPTNDCGSQVIVNGKAIGNMPAREYFKYKTKLKPEIMKAYNELADKVDIIVIEGAGSPAEINLKENDIVNMGMAQMADAPVLLVGDIDRGGVFAQLLGTLMLLNDDELDRIKGLVINKFRGDKTILDPGILMLEEKSHKLCNREIDVVGVLPYINVSIDDEDSLSERLDKTIDSKAAALINIGVVKLPRMSNYTDFTVFEQMDFVNLVYINNPRDIEKMDMVIIPGSKNTIGDLKWMRQSGMEAAVKKYSENNIVFGICGGYQMLGKMVSDPHKVEEGGEIRGMELLDTYTILDSSKIRTRVKGKIGEISGVLKEIKGLEISGYEIHMGNTFFSNDLEKTNSLEKNIFSNIYIEASKKMSEQENEAKNDGAFKGNVYGTYVHGIFDEGEVAGKIIDILARKKGIDISNSEYDYKKFKEKQYDILADMVRESMDMDKVYEIIGEKRKND